MILKKYRQARYVNNQVKIPVDKIVAQVVAIAAHSRNIVLHPANTGTNWLGIKNATQNLFGGCCLEIPQLYSLPAYSQKELLQIAGAIANRGFKHVVLSGFPAYFPQIITGIKSADPAIRVSVIFHGALSELAGDEGRTKGFVNQLELAKQGQVDSIGFVKLGLAETIAALHSIECYYLPLKTILPDAVHPLQFDGSKVHIGVFGGANFNKNLLNQVAGALQVENSHVHILHNVDRGLIPSGRITVHERLSRTEFLSLLGAMHINMHLSFSESWGQIVSESLALGVPCLSSDNNGILAFDDHLKRLLTVTRIDNPQAIAFDIKQILDQPDFSKKLIQYIDILNAKAEMFKADFINS